MKTQWARLDFTALKNLLVGYLPVTNSLLVCLSGLCRLVVITLFYKNFKLKRINESKKYPFSLFS